MSTFVYASYTERFIAAEDVKRLYENAGWWPERTLTSISKMLEQGLSVGAWNGSELVGFARAVTDGVFRAYMEDVVVHTRLRGQGIGDKIINRLLMELPEIDIISLFCEEELVPFYQRQRFKKTRQVVLHRKK